MIEETSRTVPTVMMMESSDRKEVKAAIYQEDESEGKE